MKGIPKTKVATTWVPWTYGLLARESGYGAGVDSPAWYDQLFDVAEEPVPRWLARAARLLRAEGLDASAAQVVDATRLAVALAGIRNRPLAGLDELLDATRAVLCFGSELPLKIVREELVVGHRLGAVPDETPMVPLQQDVTKLQRRLRLKPDARTKEITLDLRREIDRERSRLLHRLNVLEVPWGEAVEARGLGTFKEAFVLEWQPALELELIHAGRWGTTVQTAAAARATRDGARSRTRSPTLATLADAVLLADLPDALEAVLQALADLAALDRDTTDLMAAVPPLAQILRYGDVRGSDTSAVAGVLRGVVLRSAVGLPGAAASAPTRRPARSWPSSSTASTARSRCWRTKRSRGRGGARCGASRTATGCPARSPAAPPGSCTTPASSTPARWRAPCPARSPPARTPERGASWIEGFIGTSGLVLVHDPDLLQILDDWIEAVGPDAFTNVLPLLRRAFSVLPAGERRRLGERLRRGSASAPEEVAPLDLERARPALETIARLLA